MKLRKKEGVFPYRYNLSLMDCKVNVMSGLLVPNVKGKK